MLPSLWGLQCTDMQGTHTQAFKHAQTDTPLHPNPHSPMVPTLGNKPHSEEVSCRGTPLV